MKNDRKKFIELGKFPLAGNIAIQSALIAETVLGSQNVGSKKDVEVMIETEELTRILLGMYNRETEANFWYRAKL
ncbi:MAG: hypothetical protein K0R73_383 [Candidatus Midichloriaceae bacterium]|jgi:hypothetical protein|nr:hypothetical protein [Candidatus Midichloriaceae bacterium]